MEPKIEKMLSEPLVIINIGLNQFAQNLEDQKVEVVQVAAGPATPSIRRSVPLARSPTSTALIDGT